MANIALITYHAAYNFGSVLQAFATQTALKKLGYDAVIINYRMREQKEFYRQLGMRKKSVKWTVKRVLLFPMRQAFQARGRAYEDFFASKYRLTEEIEEPEEVLAQLKEYDVVISGSDQIWNKHSLELTENEWRFMDPYLLKGFPGRRVSYASSIGNMTDAELQRIAPELGRFDAIALREAQSAEKLSRLLKRPIEAVVDPTFLLTKEDWIREVPLQKETPRRRYILAYFLWNYGTTKQNLQWLSALAAFAKRRGCQVRLITPYIYLPFLDQRIEYHQEYGPLEFLNALYNAEAVVTDSYHGTILSVNFGKEFYSQCHTGKAEFRKTDILARLGLSGRIIHDMGELAAPSLPPIDYQAVQERLGQLREQSSQYLKRALSV